MRLAKKFMLTAGAALAMAALPAAATPGCVGKMWNPLTDLDYSLLGAIKIGGVQILPSPKSLGSPPKHKASTLCFCEDGLDSGWGLGLTYWLPAYINDVARQAGCLGFINGTNILPGFISLSSAQDFSVGATKSERAGTTSMQVHYAYADIISIAGKSIFEKCGSLSSGLKVSYLTEPDFIFQNDIYSAVLSPQVSLLAAVPLLSQAACGAEAMANTLGAWQDFGICGWESVRYPLSGNTEATNSAQVTNMEVTIKYLTRASIIGTNLRTYGRDVMCEPKYEPFYDPFQHRYQWSYPARTATRYNQNVVLWGLSRKQTGGFNLNEAFAGAGNLADIDGAQLGSNSDGTVSGALMGAAEKLLKSVPKPLNHPTKEAGYMQVWEAKSCCLILFTITDLAMIVLSMGEGIVAQLAELYNYYKVGKTIYEVYEFVDNIASIAATVAALGAVMAVTLDGDKDENEGLAESALDQEGYDASKAREKKEAGDPPPGP